MTRFWILAAALAGVLVLSACAARGSSAQSSSAASPAQGEATPANSVTPLSPEAANTMLQNGEALTLVDVRTAEEYASGHIPGAILLPNEEIGDTQPALLPELDAKIIVYCRSGRRSAQAAEKLAQMGYTQVYDLGGINSWPYETVSGSSPNGEEAAQ